MSGDTLKRLPGRPKEISKDIKNNVDATQAMEWQEGQASGVEAAYLTDWQKKRTREKFIKLGKKSLTAIGYEYRPYYNRPKKYQLCKLILVEKNQLRGNIYRRIVAKNIPTEKGQEMAKLRDEAAQKEHKRRTQTPGGKKRKSHNYGF